MKNLCCRRSWKNVLINRIENYYLFKKYLFIIIIFILNLKYFKNLYNNKINLTKNKYFFT